MVWMDSDPNILQIDGCQMDSDPKKTTAVGPHQIRLTSFRGAVGPVGDILSLEKNSQRQRSVRILKMPSHGILANKSREIMGIYPLVMTNIAMENHHFNR